VRGVDASLLQRSVYAHPLPRSGAAHGQGCGLNSPLPALLPTSQASSRPLSYDADLTGITVRIASFHVIQAPKNRYVLQKVLMLVRRLCCSRHRQDQVTTHTHCRLLG
jgi:hypothetical protein